MSFSEMAGLETKHETVLVWGVPKDYGLMKLGLALEERVGEENSVTSISFTEESSSKPFRNVEVKFKTPKQTKQLLGAVIELTANGKIYQLQITKRTPLSKGARTSNKPLQQDEDSPGLSFEDEVQTFIHSSHTLDPDLIAYVEMTSQVKRKLEEAFENIAKVHIVSDNNRNESRAFSFQPTLTSLQKYDQASFEIRCVKMLDEFLEQLHIKSCIFSPETVSSVKKKYNMNERVSRLIDETFQEIYVKWFDPRQPGKVKAVGYRNDVEEFMSFLNTKCDAEISPGSSTATRKRKCLFSDEEEQSSDEELHGFQHSLSSHDRDFVEFVKDSEIVTIMLVDDFDDLASVSINSSRKSSEYVLQFEPCRGAANNWEVQLDFEEACVENWKKFCSRFVTRYKNYPENFVTYFYKKYPELIGIVKREVDDEVHHVVVKSHEDDDECQVKVIGLTEDADQYIAAVEKKFSSYQRRASSHQLSRVAKKSSGSETVSLPSTSFYELLQKRRDLFTESEDRCILVQKLSETCSEKMLRNYFEDSSRSGGGLIDTVVKMPDGVLIIFVDGETASQFLFEEKSHVIAQQPVEIIPKKLPTIDDRRLLIEGNFTNSSDVEDVLQSCPRVEVDYRVEKAGGNSGQYLVTFSSETDMKAIMHDMKNLPLQDMNPQAQQLCKSDCIEVSKVEGLSDDRIKLAFRKQRYIVTHVTRTSDSNVALVYLSNYRDMSRILKSDLFIGKTKLEMAMCIPELKYTQTLPDWSDVAEEEKGRRSRNIGDVLQKFEDEVEMNEKIELIIACKSLLDLLNDEMHGLARVSLLGERDRESVVKVEYTPTLKQKTSNVSSQTGFERECKKRMKTFLEKLILAKHEFSFDISARLRKELRKISENTTIVDNTRAHVLIKWLQTNDGSATLVGFPEHVDELKSTYESTTDILNVEEQQYNCLSDCGIIEEAEKNFPVKITKSNHNYNLIFQGTKLSCKLTKAFLENGLKKLKQKEVGFLNKHQRQFFLDSANGMSRDVENCIRRLFQDRQIKGFLQLHEKPSLFCKAEEYRQCAQFLQEIIKCKTLPCDESQERLALDSEWMKLEKCVQESDMLLLSKDEGITLVGVSPHFEEAERSLSEYFNRTTEEEKIVELGLIEKEFLWSFGGEIDGGRVLKGIDWRKHNKGILVCGKKRDLQPAISWIKETAASLRKISDRIKEAWRIKFLLSDAGKQFLKGKEKDHQCVITIEEEKDHPLPAVSSSSSPKPSATQPVPSTSFSPIRRAPSYPTVKIPGTDVTMKLVSGDITTHRADAIVNASNEELELRSAGVSGSILRSGGSSIQFEMDQERQKIGGILPTGHAVTTGAGQLPCQKMIHVAGPMAYSTRSATKFSHLLRQSAKSCLQQADKHSLRSIAIPAISCGVFGGDVDTCVKAIVQGILDYFQTATGQHSSIKTVDLIELNNRKVIQGFAREISEISGNKNFSSGYNVQKNKVSGPGTSSVNATFSASNSCKLTVVSGDILRTPADVILNTTGPDFNMNVSKLSQHLLKIAGESIKKECATAAIEVTGFYRITGSGKLTSCEYIVHMIVPSEHSIGRLKLYDVIHEQLVEVFKKINEMKLSTLAIPAIGTGNASMSPDEAATAIKKAFEEFRKTKPRHLRTITVVVYEKRLLKKFQKILSFSDSSSKFHDQVSILPLHSSSSISVDKPNNVSSKVQKRSSKCQPVILNFCSLEQLNILKVQKALRWQFETKFSSRTISDPLLKEIEEDYLPPFEEKYTVRFSKSRDNSELTVAGLQEDVKVVCDAIKNHLLTISPSS